VYARFFLHVYDVPRHLALLAYVSMKRDPGVGTSRYQIHCTWNWSISIRNRRSCL